MLNFDEKFKIATHCAKTCGKIIAFRASNNIVKDEQLM